MKMTRLAGSASLFFFLFLLFSAPAFAGFLYALNDSNSQTTVGALYGFSVNETTGSLTALPGFPVSTGGAGWPGNPNGLLAFDPVNSRLYALSPGSNTISAYSINLLTGDLTVLPFSPISLPLASTWSCLAVHPSGSPLIAGNINAGMQLASYAITATTATPASGSPYNGGGIGAVSCAFSRDGNYLYAGGSGGTDIAGYSVDSAAGMLTALRGSPFNSGSSAPGAYATDNQGRLFTAMYYTNELRAFTTSSGIPSAVSGNPFPIGLGLSNPLYGIRHPAGFYLIVGPTNSVGVYKISGTGAATTLSGVSGNPFPTGGGFSDILALTSSGSFLYTANATSRNITAFSVNTSTGALAGNGMQPVDTLGTSGTIKGLAYAQDATPVPAGTQVFPASQAVVPVLNPVPSQARPIGIGAAASGGSTLTLRVGLGQFSAPVDIYFAITAPDIDPVNIYLLTPAGFKTYAAAGFVSWKSGTPGGAYATLTEDITLSSLPPGTYHFYLAVTPAGNPGLYSIWQTTLMR